MVKVPYGQDPYSVIGKYIRDHITAIEDIIAVIEIDGITTSQLFMVDMKEENYFIWHSDWYEGEKDVALIDFFPVSEAINPSAQPEPTLEQIEEYCRKRGLSIVDNALLHKYAQAEIQPEIPPYVAEIEAEYKKWINVPCIRKPLAKALYEVWKKHDIEDAERRTDD